MSQANISYSCSSCGYELNLSPKNWMPETTVEHEEYVNKSVIVFKSIDPCRFTHKDEVSVSCLPISCGRNSSKTKLMCARCDVLIGYVYKEGQAQSVPGLRVGSNPSNKKFVIKVSALLTTGNESYVNNGKAVPIPSGFLS